MNINIPDSLAYKIDPGLEILASLKAETFIDVPKGNIKELRNKVIASLALTPAVLGVGIALEASESELGSTEVALAECTYIQNDHGGWEYICTPDPSPSPQPSPTPTPSPQPAPSPPTTIPYSEKDNDGDGVRNGIDNCDNVVNPDQANFDGDADGDVCDPDIDNDGILNENDVNNYSSDNDNDGLHDAFDPDPTNPDIDGDGFLDGDPTELEDKAGDGTQDLFQSRIDIDGDGFSAETGDTDETNPCIPSLEAANCDQDGDGLTNEQEDEIGTDPSVADTDGDGVIDGDDKEPLSEAGAKVDKDGVTVTTTTTSSTTTTVLSETTEEGIETEETLAVQTEDNQVASTTEAVTPIVDSESSNRPEESDGSSWLLPAGVALGGSAVMGFGIFTVVRRRREEDSSETYGDTSPVAGS